VVRNNVVCFCFSLFHTRCDFSIISQGTGISETTTSRQFSDATDRTAFSDHDVVFKRGHPATSDTSYKTSNKTAHETNNKTGADLFQGPPRDATSDAAVLPTSNEFLLVGHDAVPCPPPPLHRWTGHSTRFNSYDTSWSSGPFNPNAPFTSLQSPTTPASTDSDGYFGSFCDTATGNLAFDDSFESSGEKYLPQGIHGTAYGAASGHYFGSRTISSTLKIAPEVTASASWASPVTELSTMLAHVGPIGNVVSSDVSADATAKLPLGIPPSLLPVGSRVVQTPDGPAVLLSSLQTVAHPVARSSAPRQFQHWTDEEDALLKNAAALEGGPRYNWKKISSKYFLGSRTDTQCKGRWKKVCMRIAARAPKVPSAIDGDFFFAERNGFFSLDQSLFFVFFLDRH
jgi:hypothetical protein